MIEDDNRIATDPIVEIGFVDHYMEENQSFWRRNFRSGNRGNFRNSNRNKQSSSNLEEIKDVVVSQGQNNEK